MKRFYSIVFWLIITLALFISFGLKSGNFEYTFYFLAFFIPVVYATSWIFNSILIPRYLLRKKYSQFALYTFYLFIVSLDIEFILVFLAFLLMTIYDYSNIHVIISDFRLMPLIMYLIIVISGFAQVVRLALSNSEQAHAKQITVRSERQNRIIAIEEIMYVESMADYIRIFLSTGGKVITRETISSMNQKLPEHFLRIHRSYIVNREYIDAFDREEIKIASQTLPISRTYKKEVFEALNLQN